MTQKQNIAQALELIRQGTEKLAQSANPHSRLGSLLTVLISLLEELGEVYDHDFVGVTE